MALALFLFHIPSMSPIRGETVLCDDVAISYINIVPAALEKEREVDGVRSKNLLFRKIFRCSANTLSIWVTRFFFEENIVILDDLSLFSPVTVRHVK